MRSPRSFSRIFLIGMPGTGKTTLGRKLSAEMEVPFIDMDKEIVNVTQKSIAEIFEEEGEDTFRKLEQQVLQDICTRVPAVVATGGGAPCFFDNMELMKETGVTVFINTPLEDIVERTSKDTGRPLLDKQEDIKATLNQLWEKRAPVYMQADISLDTSEPADIQELKRRIRELAQSAS